MNIFYFAYWDPAGDLKWNICHITNPAVQENHNKSIRKNCPQEFKALKLPKTMPKHRRDDNWAKISIF